MRYAFINRQSKNHSVRALCRVLGVSEQGYYQWKNLPLSQRRRRRVELRIHVRAEFRRLKGRYGSPRIWRELKEQGIICSERAVARIMREEGLRARAARKFRATTNSKHSEPVANNILNRQFTVDRPNRAWASDITYLWTSQGWVYLAVILDLYSRRVVGWAVHRRITSDLVCKAFMQAMARRSPPPGLIMHSDRGVQYASKDFRSLLSRHKAVQSMSRRGDCWDNAVAESFFHSFKVEAIHGLSFNTRREVEQEVFDYIERFYNKERKHSTLGYLSPENFERVKQISACVA